MLFERILVHVLRLRVIAHAIEQRGDAADHRERIVRHLQLFEERLRLAQVGQSVRVFPFGGEQRAAGEQRFGKHFIVECGGCDRHRLIEQVPCSSVLADGRGNLATTGKYSCGKSAAVHLRQQCACKLGFAIRGCVITFPVVIAKDEPRLDFQIRVRLAAQRLDGGFCIAFARFGIDADLPGGLLDQVRNVRLAGCQCNRAR